MLINLFFIGASLELIYKFIYLAMENFFSKTGVNRKFKPEYIKYGFIALDSNGIQVPFCLICNEALSNEALVPSKLKRHLDSRHPTLKDKPVDYFNSLAAQQNKQVANFRTFLKVSEKALIASYKIAHLLAKNKKAHTEAELIIAPALEIIVETIIGVEAAEKVKKVPLSNDTIARRIEDISSDLKLQVFEHFERASDEVMLMWSLQVDESTDISGKAQLLAFIRFIKAGKFVNEFLFCKDLKGTTKGEDIFEMVNENILRSNLKWSNCISICTDGCPSMRGKNSGFAALVLKENHSVITTHCMIHREALVAKALPENLQIVLNEAVKAVNFIKSRPLQSRLFTQLCDAMDSDYKSLLYHTEVRWLSKGKVLNRLIHLKLEIISFLDDESIDLGFSLNDDNWWLKIQFLSDLFDKLNSLNLSLQGPTENIISSTSKLKSFDEKLALWKSKVANENFDCFPLVNESRLKNSIKSDILITISRLQSAIQHYFPSLSVDEYIWVINPFGMHENLSLTTDEEEELIDLRNDKFYQSCFSETNLDEFWLSCKKIYPIIGMKAIKILIPFATSWLCEFGFSALTEIKCKKRERLLKIDDEMRACLSKLEPRFNLICSKKQAHSANQF